MTQNFVPKGRYFSNRRSRPTGPHYSNRRSRPTAAPRQATTKQTEKDEHPAPAKLVPHARRPHLGQLLRPHDRRAARSVPLRHPLRLRWQEHDEIIRSQGDTGCTPYPCADIHPSAENQRDSKIEDAEDVPIRPEIHQEALFRA